MKNEAESKSRPRAASAPKSPILGATEFLPSSQIAQLLVTYQKTERAAADKSLEAVNKSLGTKVRLRDQTCRDEFAKIKKGEDTNKQKAQKIYQLALRQAKSVLDQNNAAIAKAADTDRANARKRFQADIAPINAELEDTKTEIVTEYTAKVTAAIAEAKPLQDAAIKREEIERAEQKKKAEAAVALAAAKVNAALIPPHGLMANPHDMPGAPAPTA
jgi:hypothetical protein